MADRVLACGNCGGKRWRVVVTVRLPVRGAYSGTKNREALLGALDIPHRTDGERVEYECRACGQALAATIREADDNP